MSKPHHYMMFENLSLEQFSPTNMFARHPELAKAMRAAYQRQVDDLCLIAFDAGMRVAIEDGSARLPNSDDFDPPYSAEDALHLRWTFVMLSPGESPPAGRHWTIFENRAGTPVGRSYIAAERRQK